MQSRLRMRLRIDFRSALSRLRGPCATLQLSTVEVHIDLWLTAQLAACLHDRAGNVQLATPDFAVVRHHTGLRELRPAALPPRHRHLPHSLNFVTDLRKRGSPAPGDGAPDKEDNDRPHCRTNEASTLTGMIPAESLS